LIKAIYFDFDGVLTTDSSGTLSVLTYISKRTSIPFDVLNTSYRKWNQDLLLGRITHVEIWNAFCTDIGECIDFALLQEAYRNTPLDYLMLSFVSDLKSNYRIGLITDNKEDRIAEILSFFRIADLFDSVTVSAACGYRKNQTSIYEQALHSLDVTYQDSVFIDNDASNLIVPSAMGMKTVWFDDHTRDIPLLQNSLYEILSAHSV